MADDETPGLEHALGRLDPERWAAGTRHGLEVQGPEIVAAARRNLAGHRFTGRAADSVRASIEGGGLALTLRVGLDTSIVPEGAVLEFGRRPGRMPPPDAIATWLAATGGDSGNAFLVARAIGRRGVAGIHWLQGAVDETRDDLARNIRDGIAEATR